VLPESCCWLARSANFAGVIMFAVRGGESEPAEKLFPNWGSGAALAFLGTERGLLMAGMVPSALGFCLLDGRRYRPGAYVFMRLGVTAYLASSIISVGAETLELTSTAVYPMIVVYVTPAFRQPGSHRLRPVDVRTRTPLDRVGDSGLERCVAASSFSPGRGMSTSRSFT
jgi:hypothetical protein